MKNKVSTLLCALSLGGAAAWGQNFNTLPLTAGDNWLTFGNGNTATYGQAFTVPFSGNILDDWTFYLKNNGATPQNFQFYLMAWNGTMAAGPILYQSGLNTVTTNQTSYTPFTVYPYTALVSGNQYVIFVSVSDPTNGLGLNDSVNGSLALAGQGPFFDNGGPSASPLGGSFWYLDNGNAFSGITSTNWQNNGWGSTGFTVYNADFSAFAAQFVASPTVGAAPLLVRFTAPGTDSYGNGITQWFWNFGDGATATNQNPLHVYANNGAYQPLLLATNSNGASVVGFGPIITVEAITGLVSNGGFETGDFSGWTVTDTNTMFVVTDPLYVFSGNYGAQLGPRLGTLAQILPTTPGTAYLLSFQLDNTNDLTPVQTPNEFSVSWAGQALLSFTNFTGANWTNVTVEIPPAQSTNSGAALSFVMQMLGPSWFGLDNVDVEALVVAPVSQTVECGATASFSVVSNNENFTSYQWYAHPQDANSAPIAGATNSVLTLSNVTAGSQISYYVVCGNASGSFTSAEAPLTVIDVAPPPAITPASQTVQCGGSATLSVTDAGSATGYQWYNLVGDSQILVGTNAALTVTNLPVGSSNYFVVVTSSCGMSTSAVASLTVIDTSPPTITLLGANPMQMLVNTSFNDPGATASSSCAGTPVALTTNSSSINANVPGIYYVTYIATDAYNNSATNTRTVQVVVATYNNTVLATSNLLGFWPFTPASGPNSIVNGYTGTFQGGAYISGPGLGPPLVDVTGNTAVILNGSTGYVGTSLVGGLATNGPNADQGSVVGWFNLGALPSSSGNYFEIAGEPEPGNLFDLAINPSDDLVFYTDAETSTQGTTPLTTNDIGAWHFFAATFNNDVSANIYLDGALVVSSYPGLHVAPGTTNFNMGATLGPNGPGNFFSGSLADIAIFNRQLTGAEIANLYAAATTPLSVSITSPTNLESFTTNQTIVFSANAVALNGVQQLALYLNSSLVASGAATSLSTVLSNLPTGSYVLTATVTDNNNSVVSAVAHVTVNVPGTTLIDFDALDASAGPVGGAALSNYLASFGVAVGNVTGGATLAVQEGQNVINQSGSQLTVAYSQPNLLTQFGAGGPISYTLVFSSPCTSVSWERTELLASGGGLVGPAWSAYAFDSNGNEISQVGEGQILSLTTVPARAFTLYGSNISYVTFAADNTLSPLDTLPLDNLLLSTNALGPIPQITLTASGVTNAEPGEITLSAQASENGGTITSIGFYENGGLIGSPALTVVDGVTTASIPVTSLAPGTYTFNATATDANGVTTSSTNVTLPVNAVAGVAVINFDDLTILDTSAGAVGGTNLSNYLAGFGVTISNATLGTSLEAISESSFSGNEIPLPTSLPNLFTQVGSSQPVTFSLYFATNLHSFGFTRVGLNTNGASGITHPAWSASVMDASGNVLESVSEPLLFSSNNIPPRTFTLYGNGIASVRFNSDSQRTAAFGAVLLDDLVLDANPAANPLSVSLAQPTGPFTAPASIPLTPNVTDGFGSNFYVAFYSGPSLIGTNAGGNSTFTWSNVLNGNFQLTAQVIDSSFGYALFSSPATTVTVAPGGISLVVNFDDPNALANLPGYLATNGMMSIASNTPGSTVAAENQTNAVLAGDVIPSSLPNLLTQTNPPASNGPVSFTVVFSNLLTQFSFTRPELLANPSVSLPGWQAMAFDALGQPLEVISAPLIASSTNVPAQTYTLSNAVNGAGIGSVEFSSDGTGLTTFNAVLLDDFVLTTNGILAPSILITSQTNGQVLTSLAGITLSAEAADGAGTLASVAFYYGGANLIGVSTNSSTPFSILWTNAPTNNGVYSLTAVAVNNSDMTNTSAPVVITLASGFAIVTPPASQTIPQGGSATFTVGTMGTPTAYQWQSNGLPINGADSATLSISNAQLSMTGSYSVVVSRGGQSVTSAPALLTVLGPPSITSYSSLQPVVNLGDTFTLSVSASDVVPFDYQWKLNGTPIPGATNSSLTVSNAQPYNSGAYDVVVANIVAFSNSPIFSVEVNFPGNVPTTANFNFANSFSINPLIGPVTGINSNSPAAGELPIIAGKPAGKFLWYNWTATFTGTISLDTLGSSFDTLMGVYTGNNVANLASVGQDDDSGGYFASLVSFNCVQGTTYQIAVAGYNGAVGTVVLGLAPGTGYRILNPTSGAAVPVITQQPSNQIVTLGQTVTLSMAATNATAYQWYFANAPVTGANTTNLVISNFPAGAIGVYYALAANAVGSAQTEPAAVEFQNPSNTAGAPNTLMVDKFIDAVDLTAGITPEHYRPAAAGGETAGYTLSQSFSTVGATKEAGEPNHAGQPGGASYWYSYTARYDGSLRFDTTNSSFNTILAIYGGPGTSFSSLVPVGSNYTTNYVLQGQPSVWVSNVLAGEKFFIAIDGYKGASGSARLNVFFTPLVLSSNYVSITNQPSVLAITFPPRNYLTTSSSITVRGTISAVPGKSPGTNVMVMVNGRAQTNLTFGLINASGVLVPVPGGVEEVGQETLDWVVTGVGLTNGANFITAQTYSVARTNLEIVSRPVTRTVFYVTSLPSPQNRSSLTLLASPSDGGKITGQASGAYLEINKPYTVNAVPFRNWVFTNWTMMSGTNTISLGLQSGNASLSFLMSTNLTLQANFITNPFSAFAGVYHGLFSPPGGVTEASSGFFTATISGGGGGAYTARLLLNGGAYPFSGTFNLAGDADAALNLPGRTLVVVELHLDLAAANNQITGAVIDETNNGWSSVLLADRAVFNARRLPATNFAGRYTLIIPPGDTAPTNEPGGYGYAILTNNLGGLVVLSGRLADGAAFSQSVPVATNGDIPLYASLYANKGSLQGWLTLANTTNTPSQTLSGANLTWIKASGRSDTLYAAGFTNTNIIVLGSFYKPPSAGSSSLNLTNGTLIISNGPGNVLIYSNLTITDNKLGNQDAAGNPANLLQGTIAPGTGVLTLTFRPNGAGGNITGKGVVLQDDSPTNAAGWFLDDDQSGSFLLLQQ